MALIDSVDLCVVKKMVLSLAILALIGCDSGQGQKTPEQIQSEIATSQKRFAEERRRIEEENRAREKQIAEQRSLVGARFVSVNSEYIDVELTNHTDKAIDNLAGSLDVLDQTGNYVTGVALTNWVPGDIYLPVGGSTPARKSLQLERPGTKAKILREAKHLNYHYTVHRVQYVGESEISFIEPSITTQQKQTSVNAVPEGPPKANPNQAHPEPCAANQLTFETAEIYYPGPKCEHVERNIDSERFKQEYIRLCQSETKAVKAPLPAARVQLSSCMQAPSGSGIVYKKRICCERP